MARTCCKWIALASATVLVVADAQPAKKVIPQDECGLWLAPSSTSAPDSPKLGLFAGTDFGVGEVVGSPEISIPFIDFVEDWNRQSELDDAILGFLEGYLWTAEYSGAKNEANSVVTMIPGHGVLAQFHSGTCNVDWLQASALLRTPPDVPSPGVAHGSRGAITPYFNFSIAATQPIKAGMEIFANFGDAWENKTDDVFQEKVTRSDYEEADKVLEKILDFMDKYRDEMKPGQDDEILDFILGKILDASAGSRAKAIRSLIPAHPGKLQTVKNMGGTFPYRNPDLVKSKKWLAKHGTCVDNLKSGPSTIPEAGRGAFATRSLPKGTVIAPMPMLQIPDKQLMNVYEMYSDGLPNKDLPPIGQQLVVNYCYGHLESNMLLLPIGPMVNLINHQAQPNAKIQWSKNKYWGNHEELLDALPEELAEEEFHYIGAVMEVVAIRNIKRDEEVFIDYGSEWVKAYNTYVKEWEAKYKDTPEWPLQADDLKVAYRTKPFKTLQELQTEPYPDGVQTACFIEVDEIEDGRVRETSDGKEIAKWIGPVEFRDYSGVKLENCDILERYLGDEDGFYNYTVVTEDMQIELVPHAAITFWDKPYRSDIHTKGAFRHSIGIPDGMFPQAWRDVRE
jgi:hypothetical protein